MNGFSGLSYAQIQGIAGNLESKASAMEGTLNNITAELNKVGNDEVWSGTAAASAMEEFKKLVGEFQYFHKAIRACSEHLKTVVANYQAVDKAVSQIK